MRRSTTFFATLLTLAATVVNGCAPSPTPIATSEIPTPTLALPTATAIPPTPTSRTTPQPTATVPATVTPVPTELPEQLDALHMAMFLIQVDAELLGEAALRVQSGDLDKGGLGGVFTAANRYADTIDQVASGIPVPEGLSPAWDEAFEAHMETRAILSRWSNAEIDPEQVIAQVEPVRQSAAHALQVAELWMMQLVGGDTVGLAAARAKQLARMVDQVLAPITTYVLYVRSDAASRTCDSWENACGLQTALHAAEAGDEIWVKAGIYRPAADTSSITATFQLKEGVAVYGGFAGTETTRDQRIWETNITVLSGDLGGDDITDPNGVVTDTVNIVGLNAYHVVTGSTVNATAVLDGFIITAGCACQKPKGFGGGMVILAGSPTLNNLVFSGNTAGKGAAYYGGGAMYISSASNPVLTHVTFVANTAGGAAGMFNDRGSNPVLNDVAFSGNKAIDASCMGNYASSSPVLNGVVFDGNSSSNKGCMVNEENSNPILTDVTFSSNSARYGSGMYNYKSSPTLTDVVFSNNEAGHVGGGMENEDHSNPILNNVLFSGNSAYHAGGGMINAVNSNPILMNVAFINNTVTKASGGGMDNANSSPVLTNVTFSGNHAVVGGGINNWQSSLTLTNVTFSENTADQYGAAMYSQESTPTIINTIIWGNTPGDSQMLNARGVSNVSHSIIAGGHPGTRNLNINPLLGALADNGGFTPTYSLPLGSPAIDAGSSSNCPAMDQRGMLRPVDGDGNGSAICDIGAFEYQKP